MKKLFIALAIFGMIGSASAITVSAVATHQVVTVKGDPKEKKRSSKKKKDCCSKDSAGKSGCSKEGDKKKGCCSGH